MTWEIAFTIVGCVWALVVFSMSRTHRLDEMDRRLMQCQSAWSEHGRDVEWLKGAYRKLLGMDQTK